MRKLFGRISGFAKVLSLRTYLWCLTVIVFSTVLCRSFFMTDQTNRQILVYGKTLQDNDMPTDYNKTLVVRTISSTGNALDDREYNYALLTENALSREVATERTAVIATGRTADEVNEESQAGDPVFGVNNYSGSLSVFPMYADFGEAHGYIPELDDFAVKGGITLDEYYALCRIIQAEAESEDKYGKRLIANVIINRINSNMYPDRVEEVITEKGQFAPVERGYYYKAAPNFESKIAAMEALNGEDESKEAIFFQKSPSKVWDNKTYLFRYGSHSFYK